MMLPGPHPRAIHQHSGPPAGPGELLRFQLERLIVEILAAPDLDPSMYVSLIGRLTEYPGHPEQALLAHLGDVQGPEDLPPYKAGKRPTLQPSRP
ncbi:hypothetical protein ACFRAU_11480 [Arthrobacter sp. NPDC056691]|uniref:hypothetical protein n=1 Tax=Arthrobacter sp. NPDC056691 TaxID=3345913 RepID=UPI00366CFD2C